MVPCRKQIRNKGQRFSAAGDNDGLNVGVVAGNSGDGDARKDLGVAIDQVPESGVGDRLEIFGEIAGAVAISGRGWRAASSARCTT